jgi:hypothetical protein
MKSTVAHWTDSRYKSFVTSAIRGAFGRFPNKFAALKNAFVGKKTNKKTGREASHYKCAGCKKQFVAKDVAVDHVLPVVDPVVGFVSWDVYIERMFCDISNLQVLCSACHKEKTAEERKARCTTTKKSSTTTPSPSLKKSVRKSASSKSGGI